MANYKLTQTGEEIQEILDKVEDITASAEELNYCEGVTSNIQTQLDNTLTKPDAVLSSNELIGFGTDGEQIRVQLGDVFVLDGSTSPYTLDLNTYDGEVE